jgi:mono/diheme cytochrome c family protein
MISHPAVPRWWRKEAAMLLALRSAAALLALGLVVASTPAGAQELRGSVGKGRIVARTQCGDCHAVGREGPWMWRGVPSFPAIAELPSTTALSLRVTLRTTHVRKRMPNLLLSRTDTDDVIAYILSLARK